MKSKLDAKKSVRGGLDAPRLSTCADTIAWIRELALSIRLTAPEDDASIAELKQYTWNSAICLAIVEISDRLLKEEFSNGGKSHRLRLQRSSKSDGLPS